MTTTSKDLETLANENREMRIALEACAVVLGPWVASLTEKYGDPMASVVPAPKHWAFAAALGLARAALGVSTPMPAEMTNQPPPRFRPSSTVATVDRVDRSEYFRQLFVTTYDALKGTDEYGASLGDDPPFAGYGDKRPRPLEDIANAERGRFGYERKVTLASVEAALNATMDDENGIKPTIEQRDLRGVRNMLEALNSTEAKAASYLAALEALLADLPVRCVNCGNPSEWVFRGHNDTYHVCTEHKNRSALIEGWTPLRTGRDSLALARTALGLVPT